MVAAITIINIFVIPQFAKIFARANFQLPITTRVLIGMSSFVVQYWPVVILFIGGIFFAFRAFIAGKEGRYSWDKFKLRLPIAGQIITKGTMARFARSFALASKSGVPIGAALGVVARTVDNAYIASAVEQMRDGVERGESILRTATTTGVFQPMVLQMIAVGEESGELDSLMDEIADMYEHEVEYELKTLSARIEPILITFMGILVLILALGVFVPMWQLGQVQLHKH
jgi:MSHA biogenesis protein MshG